METLYPLLSIFGQTGPILVKADLNLNEPVVLTH